jgi:hypothetical protein
VGFCCLASYIQNKYKILPPHSPLINIDKTELKYKKYVPDIGKLEYDYKENDILDSTFTLQDDGCVGVSFTTTIHKRTSVDFLH